MKGTHLLLSSGVIFIGQYLGNCQFLGENIFTLRSAPNSHAEVAIFVNFFFFNLFVLNAWIICRRTILNQQIAVQSKLSDQSSCAIDGRKEAESVHPQICL